MESPFLSNERKKNIEIDLQPLQSMKADRKATYNSLYRKIIKRIEKRKWKDGQKILEPSCLSSSVMQGQKISETTKNDDSWVKIWSRSDSGDS